MALETRNKNKWKIECFRVSVCACACVCVCVCVPVCMLLGVGVCVCLCTCSLLCIADNMSRINILRLPITTSNSGKCLFFTREVFGLGGVS